MNKFNKEFWTKRYQDNEAGWDLGTISTPLKEYIDQLTDKNLRILIPGAGNAHEAEYLFHKGFTDVTVIDISELPLQNIQERLPNFPKENLILADFFEHQSSYDLIIEQTFFCALDRSLREQYVAKMQDLLKPKGKLVGLLFTDPIDTDLPPFGAKQEEYINLFNSGFEFKTFEESVNSIKPRMGRELFINFVKK